MSIPPGYKHNFETMMRAASDGRLALMECVDNNTGSLCYVVCMVSDTEGTLEEYDMVPVARMFDGNPYEELTPPS
jgi:hypothetical protein